MPLTFNPSLFIRSIYFTKWHMAQILLIIALTTPIIFYAVFQVPDTLWALSRLFLTPSQQGKLFSPFWKTGIEEHEGLRFKEVK